MKGDFQRMFRDKEFPALPLFFRFLKPVSFWASFGVSYLWLVITFLKKLCETLW